MFQKPNKKPVLFKRTLTTLVLGLLTMATILYGGFVVPQRAHADTNSTINFQARLQMIAGSVAPDGKYNVQFKLYSATSGGTALWTESYYDSNGATAGNDNRVNVANGYVSVNLGSQTAFPTTINWDQQLYLTMNVGGTDQSATPTYDGEMNPRLRLTGVPYAFRAGALSQYNSTTTYTSTLSVEAPTGGNQNFVVQDQGAAGTYNLLTRNVADANFIQLQTGSPGTAQTGNINISGTAIAGSFKGSSLDTPSAGTLTIGGTNATTINIGTNDSQHSITLGSQAEESLTTIQGGAGTGGLMLKVKYGGGIGMYIDNVLYAGLDGNSGLYSKLDSNTAFNVMTTGGSSVFSVDTVNNKIHTGDYSGVVVGFGGIVNHGGLTLDGGQTANTLYTTAAGTVLHTAINIPNFDPGDFNQLLAMGLPTNASSSARAITLSDGRVGAHQPTLAVLSVDDQQIFGLSWDGSSTVPVVKSTTGYLGLFYGGGQQALFDAHISGLSVLALGVGTNSVGGLALNNATNSNTVTVLSGTTSAGYNIILPSAIGSAGQCLTVASVATVNETLGYASCGTVAPTLQNAYDNSSNPATIALNSTNHGLLIKDASTTVGGDLFSVQNNAGSSKFFNVTTSGASVAGTLTSSGAITATSGGFIGGSIDAATAFGTLNVGPTNAYALNVGSTATYGLYLKSNNIEIASSAVGTIKSTSGATTFTQSAAGLLLAQTTNSTSAFQIQNSNSNLVFGVDSSNNTVTVKSSNTNSTSAFKVMDSGLATIFNVSTDSSNRGATIATNSFTAFQVQDGSFNSLFTVDTSSQLVVVGSTSNGISMSATGYTLAGTARTVKRIMLTPEYAGAVLDPGSGSNNTGTMTSGFDSTNRTNYYKWTTAAGSNQSYDVVVQVPLPKDINAWNGSNPLCINAYTSNTTNGTVTAQVLKLTGTADSNYSSFHSFTPGSTGSWTNSCYALESVLSGAYASGDYLNIRIRMQSPNAGDVRIGNIYLDYLSTK